MTTAGSTQFEFYATAKDIRAVLEFFFTSTDIRVFELRSKWEQELREFRTVTEVESVCPMTTKLPGKPQVNFLLWSTSAHGAKVNIRRYPLNPKRCDGHTFAFELVGAGLMSFYVGGVNEDTKIIIETYFAHESQAKAESNTLDNADLGTDWAALKVASNKIVQYIRKRLAVDEVQGRPILPGALELVRAGYNLPGILPREMKRLRKPPEESAKKPRKS